MKQIVLYDQNGQRIKLYTDFYAFVEENYTDEIKIISFAGFDTAVQAAKAAITKKENIYVEGPYYNDKYTTRNTSYRFLNEKINEYTHTIAVSDEINNPDVYCPIVLIWENEDKYTKIFNMIQEKYPIPLAERWAKWLIDYLIKQKYILKLETYNDNKNIKLELYKICITKEELLATIRYGLEKNFISINGEADIDFKKITLTEYIKKYSNIFAQKIEESFKPIYNPLNEKPDKLTENLKRQPFKAQADVITAAAKTLDRQDSIIIVGDMGTGKTLIGSAIPYIHSKAKPYRAIVMCPAHLTEKWEREIKNTVPDAKINILHNWKDILKLNRNDKKEGFNYYIISKDKAKLSYSEKTAFVKSKYREYITCPVCGKILRDKDKIPINESYFATHTKKNDKCPYCKTKLWQADNEGPRRYAVSEYIKRHLKGYFDYFISDEVHELKGGDTAQGNTFGILSAASKKTIALTGTLLGGYASDIFYILYRLNPQKMLQEGFRYNDETKFTEKYGAIEIIKTIKEDKAEYNKSSKGWKESVTKKKLPVISPLVFSNFLLNQCIFLQISDLQQQLPEYKEYVEIVEPDPELSDAYDKLASDLRDLIKANSFKNLGLYLMTLLRYPDHPLKNEQIQDPETGYTITPTELSEKTIYNKEQYLLNHVLTEVNNNRNVFIYAQFTGEKDITYRLEMLLNKTGIKTCVLKSSVPAEKREKWLKEKVREGYKCIISNFDLVKTGLDLYDFPTIIFYETGYSTYTLRQAAKRSWRIGQTKPVKVIFMVYKNTLQYNALALMGNKMEAAMNIEGQFSEDGLRALASNYDMLTELAKSLIKGLDPSISIENIWKTVDSDNNSNLTTKEKRNNIIDSQQFFKTIKLKTSKKGNKEIEQLCINFDAI